MTVISKKIAILFSDIKDYSKIKDENLYPNLNNFNRDFERLYLNNNNNFFCRTRGDSFYICSYQPVDLAEIALNLRDKFRNTHWTRIGYPFELQVRIGLHFDEASIIEEDGEIIEVVGDNINATARIEPIVEPNQIYCSETFYEQLQLEKNLKIKLISLGSKQLPKEFGQMGLYKVLWNYETNVQEESVRTVNKGDKKVEFTKPKIRKQATDQELNNFAKLAFKTIYEIFAENLNSLKDDDVTIEINKVNERRFSCNIYVQGKSKAVCSIWIGNDTPILNDHNTIYYSSQSSHYNENSYNDCLYTKHDGFNFFLQALGTSYMQNNKNDKTILEAAEYLWKSFTNILEH